MGLPRSAPSVPANWCLKKGARCATTAAIRSVRDRLGANSLQIMKLFTTWAQALFRWLAEVKYFLIAIGVTIVALRLTIRPGTTEPFVRLTGLVLQLLGVATVIWGISETRAMFGLSSTAVAVRSWLKRFPDIKREAIIANGNCRPPKSTVSLEGYTMDYAGRDASIETRVEVLEKNLIHTNQRIDRTKSEFGNEVRNSKLALQSERLERTTEDQKIHAKLIATNTGGVHISVIGALWLFVGVTLSTASQEIFKWLG